LRYWPTTSLVTTAKPASYFDLKKSGRGGG
jgi:hypothetical protein